jgi:hypothetical protein
VTKTSGGPGQARETRVTDLRLLLPDFRVSFDTESTSTRNHSLCEHNLLTQSLLLVSYLLRPAGSAELPYP